MKNKAINYITNFLISFSAFVIVLSLKKGYADFLGIPLFIYIVLLTILVAIAVIEFLKKRKRLKQNTIQEK